jgi:hypothetical protein
MSLLSTAKQVLIDGAIELYELRRSELDLDILSYEIHYRNLGSLIFQIDCYESLGDILNDMEKDNLQELGYFGGDQFLLEEFLKKVRENL